MALLVPLPVRAAARPRADPVPSAVVRAGVKRLSRPTPGSTVLPGATVFSENLK